MIVSQFYLDIMERLRTGIVDEQGAPKIKHFDYWNFQTEQQDEEDNDELPFATPAVFLELIPSETITLGNKKQMSELTFQLHVATEVYTEHSSSEELEIRNRSLEHMFLLDDIFARLQNHNGSYFNSINRIGIPQFDHEHSQVYKHLLPFKTLITDVAAMHALKHVTPDLKVIQGPNLTA